MSGKKHSRPSACGLHKLRERSRSVKYRNNVKRLRELIKLKRKQNENPQASQRSQWILISSSEDGMQFHT
jgi:hypothetical protein